MFDNHLTAAQMANAPKLVRHADGSDRWVYGDIVVNNIGMNAVAGRPPEEYGFEPSSLEGMRRGCWDVHARIGDMNANGILGSINFGSFVAMDGSMFLRAPDKKAALIHLKAYNDWHIDEWCGAYPGRFIPMAILPLWDVNECVAEVKRVVAKGCHAVSFPDNASARGLPSIHSGHWEPFWKVCADNNIMVNCHIGTGNMPPHPSMESPIEVWTICMPIAIALAAADWLHLDAMKRYPLKVALTEGGIGWIPYFLERADFTNWRHKAWTNSEFAKKPSDLFREHFYTCFVDDKFGVDNLDKIGEDHVFYECDYPHSDSVWPNSPEIFHESAKHLSDVQINKITHLNAMKAYSYDPFSVLDRKDCTVGALRAQAKAAGVDTSPFIAGGANRPVEEGVKRVVTSGDVVKLFMEQV
jgi:predicted TIM-barrel fold metal-dependent hydrolase